MKSNLGETYLIMWVLFWSKFAKKSASKSPVYDIETLRNNTKKRRNFTR